MANTYTTLNSLFTAIANSLRAKKNSTETIVADNFPTEIDNLRTGFDYNNSSVTSIPDYAFYGCEDLNSVDCYNLTSIGTSAFENCTNFKKAILPNTTVDIGENAFKGCPSDLIIHCAFDNQPETWHENWNPDNCRVIWNGLLKEWNVAYNKWSAELIAKLYVDIYDNNKYSLIVDGMYSTEMRDWSVKEISMGDDWHPYSDKIFNVLIINAFNIGGCAFYGFKNLKTITISDRVTEIGYNAFRYCSNLTSITYIGTIAQWQAITFDTSWNRDTGNYTIHCTDGDIAKDGTITYHTTT